MHVTREQTMENLRRHDIADEFSFLPVLPKASVLIPLMVKHGQVFTLMTLRSQEVRRAVWLCVCVCLYCSRRSSNAKLTVHSVILNINTLTPNKQLT